MADIHDLEIFESINNYLFKVSKYFKIEKVYLFGSFAIGKSHKDSDIDLAIVSSSLSGNSFTDNIELGKLTWGIDTRIEPIGFTPKDFEEMIFAKEIKKVGIEIPIKTGHHS